ncbi:MAG: hypothetical protein KJZ86_13760 [Caldilineaceae bacterium]|nr:hypothetical protein [Caldilineaceae bacterium]
MSDKVRIVLHIDADAAGILDETVTPRQKGVYISKLLRDAQRQAERGDTGILERMERKLDRLIESAGKG